MSGGSEAPLIVVPGALGALEGGDLGGRLGGTVRTIDYRADDGLEALIGRVLDLAEADGAERFDLLGQSYGGWIAQCVARAHPERVRRLILSHSFALEPGQAWRFALARRLIAALPAWLRARLLEKRGGKALAPVAARDPALHRRLVEALRKRACEPEFWNVLIGQQRCLEQSLRAPFAALPPVASHLPVLIVESADDPLLGARDRAALRARFPRAEIVRFETAGHVSALAEPERLAEAVRAFLGRD